MLWIKVWSVECGKLVDWAACVCATIDYPGPTATWSAMFSDLPVFVPKETIEYPTPHGYSTWSAMLPVFKWSVNSCPCENTHGRPSAYCMCVE